MELTPYNAFTTALLQLGKILYWDIRNGNYLPQPLTYLQPFADNIPSKRNQHWNNKIKHTQTESSASQQSSVSSETTDSHKPHDVLTMEDIKLVMNKLGLEYSEGMSIDTIAGIEIVAIFDQDEPSFDEIKEAFDVFDKNRDGFIDEMKLQGVLLKLGQYEGAGLEECRKMISRFDENGDGLIDFKEFTRLMEKSFC